MSFFKNYLFVFCLFFFCCATEQPKEKKAANKGKAKTEVAKNKGKNKKSENKPSAKKGEKNKAANKGYWERLKTAIKLTDKQIVELKKIRNKFSSDKTKLAKAKNATPEAIKQLVATRDKAMEKLLGEKLYKEKQQFDKKNNKK